MYLGYGLHHTHWGHLRDEVIAQVAVIAIDQRARFGMKAFEVEGLLPADGGVRLSMELSRDLGIPPPTEE